MNYSNIDLNPNIQATNMRQYQMFDNVLKTREALLRGNFWDQNIVNRFIELFSQFIDILKADYDPITFSINIKIKKTTVKKMPNYRAESIFYYNAVGNAMMILLKEQKDRVIDCLAKQFNISASVYDLYFCIINDVTYVYNLTNVQCISDNIVQIVL